MKLCWLNKAGGLSQTLNLWLPECSKQNITEDVIFKRKKDSKLELLLAKHSKSQLDPKERLCVENRRW
jgi:hypothetical protein